MKVWTIAGAALIAVGAGAAVAQDKEEKRVERVVLLGGPGEGGRQALDTDKDGAISREEFSALHARMFERLDENKDGKLGEDEFGRRGGPDGLRSRHGGPGPHRRMMMLGGGERLDANKDGRLTLEEMTAPMREHFARLDANKDGALDEKEREAMHGARMFERKVERR